MSYVAVIHAKPGRLLLGEESTTRSLRFGLKSDAEVYRTLCLSTNGDRAGASEIEESELPPQLFPHCAHGPAQAVGTRCAKCRGKVTDEDAVWFNEHAPR